MKNRKKVLCFIDFDKGRDIEILMPVVYYIERYLDADVKFEFLYNLHLIYIEKPHAVLVANSIGSRLHFLIVRYAAQNNIPVFTLFSEGNFRTDGTVYYYLYNPDRIFYEENICLWSKRTFDFMCNDLPQYKDKIVLTGATGFDRFKIYKFADRDTFFKRYNAKQYDKVISYFGWLFGKLFTDRGLEELDSFFTGQDVEAGKKWLQKQMNLVEDVLRKAIENNPDTLFILKRHPTEKQPHITLPDRNEMSQLAVYPNVIYVVKENVHDIISVSDLVLGFETTTALETWCIKDNPTILINPDVDFKRDKLYLGSLIVGNYTELQAVIDEYYSTGTIAAFNTVEKQTARKKLTSETIGFADGMNHIRTSFYFGKMIEKVSVDTIPKVKINIKYMRWFYMIRIGKLFYCKNIFIRLPKFKKTIWVFENMYLKNIPILKKEYYVYLDEFHNRNNIPQKITSKEFWDEVLNNEITIRKRT
jgi:hypothetical protein